IECVIERIGATELHLKIDIDESLVGSEHAGLLTEAFDGLNVDDLLGLDRPRQMPTQPRLCGRDVLTEAKHDRTLRLIDLIQACKGPDREQDDHDRADAEAGQLASASRTARTASATENASEPPAQVAENLVQVRRPLVRPVTAAPRVASTAGISAGFVPYHVGWLLLMGKCL